MNEPISCLVLGNLSKKFIIFSLPLCKYRRRPCLFRSDFKKFLLSGRYCDKLPLTLKLNTITINRIVIQ